jgi:hypothetical protein
MKSSDLKEQVSLAVKNIFAENGFAYKKTSNEFSRDKNDFSYIFNILQSSWPDHFSLSFRLFIRHKEIEKYYDSILGKSHGITMGNTIERISKSPDGKGVKNGSMFITIFADEDIEPAAESIQSYFSDLALPYFEKYQALKEVDEIFNNPPFGHCPADVGGIFAERCIKGLIVARLVNNPDYSKLVSIYDEAIKETRNEASMENYRKVKEYLMYNRIK